MGYYKSANTLYLVYLYCMPIIFIAMSMAVLSYQPRNLMVDRLCLLAIFALSDVLYLKKRWIISLALIFALISLFLNLTPFNSGWISTALRYCAESRLPTPRTFDPRDFIDYNDRRIYMRKIEQEIIFYNFFLVNFLVFLVCLSARFFLNFKQSTRQNQINLN